MKRVGCLYQQMGDWMLIVEAEAISTKRKKENRGVVLHIEHRWQNLIEIQNMVLEERMCTGKYKHEQRISGQDKMRDIAKLDFHPSHIEHQLLTLTVNRRVDRALIRHTYASRQGYGQIACALHIRDICRKYKNETRWYCQCDIVKYYEHIPHALLRKQLNALFKDKKLVDAFMEPFEKFAEDGVGIPLGIRPSQTAGNLALYDFDHHMLEKVKVEDYVRYLDDFMFTGATKGEVKRKFREAEAFLNSIGFELHVPKIHRISEGINMMGFVFDSTRNGMWWRKANKRRWLKHRARVTNPKRLRELDDAAWGMLKWGNKDCHRLWEMKTGREIKQKDKKMVPYSKSGIRRTESVDANGQPFLEDKKIGMGMLLDKPVEITRWIPNITTAQGPGRFAVRVLFMGDSYKLIVNAKEIKTFLEDMTRNHVTKFRTVFVDRGSLRYGIDEKRTEILEVDGRQVSLNGNNETVFEDGTLVNFSNNA